VARNFVLLLALLESIFIPITLVLPYVSSHSRKELKVKVIIAINNSVMDTLVLSESITTGIPPALIHVTHLSSIKLLLEIVLIVYHHVLLDNSIIGIKLVKINVTSLSVKDQLEVLILANTSVMMTNSSNLMGFVSQTVYHLINQELKQTKATATLLVLLLII